MANSLVAYSSKSDGPLVKMPVASGAGVNGEAEHHFAALTHVGDHAPAYALKFFADC
jgi:hypothetical protein